MKAFEIITGAGETLRVNLPGKMQACILYLERVVGETIGHKVTE
jgi:molybdopterin biosynthesis enzyme MoaB